MNRKLTLDVDALSVTSFEAEDSKALGGTVNGHAGPAHAVTQWVGCVPGCNTRLTCSTNLC